LRPGRRSRFLGQHGYLRCELRQAGENDPLRFQIGQGERRIVGFTFHGELAVVDAHHRFTGARDDGHEGRGKRA
jgi:hypothetical protein